MTSSLITSDLTADIYYKKNYAFVDVTNLK